MVRCGRVNREENQDFCSLQAASTRTIIRIIPVYLVILVIVEFHALDDMITEPDTDIGVRLYIAWRCRRTSADIDPLYRAKAGRKIDLIGRSALNPGPAETLSAAVERQIDSKRLGFCRTDAHEPALMRSHGSAGCRPHDCCH